MRKLRRWNDPAETGGRGFYPWLRIDRSCFDIGWVGVGSHG